MSDNSDDDILELPNIGVEYPQYQRIPPPSLGGRKRGGTGGPPPSISGRTLSAAPVTLGPRVNPGFPRHENWKQNGGSTTAFPQYPGPGMVPGATAGVVPGASSMPEDFTSARVSRFSRGKWTSGIDHGEYNYNQQTSAGQPMNYENPSGSGPSMHGSINYEYSGMNKFPTASLMGDRNKSGAIDKNASLGELINDIKKSNNKRRRDESLHDDSIEVVDLDQELPDLFTPEARARLTQNENSNQSAGYFNSIDFHSEKSNSPELLGYIPPKKGRVKKSIIAKKATGKKRGPKKKSDTAMDAVNAMMSLANGSQLDRAGPSGYYPPNQSNSGTDELEVLRSMIRQMQSMQHQMPGHHTNESVKESETYMLLLKGLDALKKRAKHTYLLNREVKCQQHRAGGIAPRVICSVCHWPGDIQLAFVDNQIQTDMVKDFLKSPKNDVWENLIYSVFSDGRLGSNSVLHVDNYGQMWRNHLNYSSSSKDSNRMEMLGPSSSSGGPVRIIPPSLSMSASYEAMSFPQLHEDEEEEDNDMGVAETYSDYMPRKLDVGKKHPDQVIETASMSSVEPPDISYTLGLPEKTIEEAKLSALQLESIVYASQAHEKMLMDGNRAGFLIGDGAGVGKGRTVAGVIFENWRKGRKKHIWVSVSNDLKYDAERDLKDIGAVDIQVQSLSKVKYGKIKELNNGGVIFSTYSALIAERSSGGGQFNSRLKQLVNWCGGKSFDGCIIFDECHRAKNLYTKGKGEPTKTGWTVLNIQTMLPHARVVYASATGASEPKDMAYMVRLGLWGEGAVFREFGDFFQAVDKRGVGAMEIVAMDMKLRGMYIARQLSFNGVSFRIEEVPLSPAYKESYNAAVKVWVSAMHMFLQAAQLIKGTDKRRSTSMWRQFWAAHQRFFKYLCIGAKVDHVVALGHKSIVEGKCVVIGLQSTGETRMAEQYEADAETFEFASSAKGVLENLVEKHFPGPSISKEEREKMVYGEKRKPPPKKKDKVKPPPPPPIKKAYDSCEDSDDSDILIISDGEDKAEDSDSDISILSEHIESRPNGKFDNGLHYHNFQDLEEADFYADIPWSDLVTVMRLKCDLLDKIDDLGTKLPPNTLDQLISELGGPKKVAEMTGRKKRVVKDASGRVVYEDRSEQDIPLEILNIKEKERFMNGDKLIAIISEAASSGISLQSDRRVKNQRRRVHMTLELPWSADRAIQQFGRTHRSNQANGPEYVFLISELAGERRFASIVAKRLESLGALTHGDRRATTDTRDLTSFNIDNKYGRLAVEAAMSGMMGLETPLVPPPEDYEGSFFQDCCSALTGVGIVEDDGGTVRLHKDYNNLGKFLNRILGTPVDIQNRLFAYFTKTMAAILLQAKRSGKYDLGILDISSGTECKKIKTKTWETRHPTGKANINLHTVTVERGMVWQESLDKFLGKQDADELDGFYLSHQVRNNKKTAILALDVSTGRKKSEKSPEKRALNIESPEKKAVNIENKIFAIHRPNTGLQIKHESYEELKKKYKKANLEEAKKFWEAQYVASLTTCSHAYWQGNCRRVSMGHECDIGTRRRTYHILCGLVLNVWAQVENVLAGSGGRNNKMQVIRVKTTDGDKLVGTLIPNMLVKIMTSVLDQNSENVFERTFEVDDISLFETSQPNIGEIVLDGSEEEESDNEEKSASKFSQNTLQNLKDNVTHEIKSNSTVDLDNSSLHNSNMNVSRTEGNDSINEVMKRNTLLSESYLSPEQNGDSLNRQLKQGDIRNEHLVDLPESSTPIKYRYLNPDQNFDSLNSQVKLEESGNQTLNSLPERSMAISVTPIKSDFNEKNCDSLNSQVKLEESRNQTLNILPERSMGISVTPIKSDINEKNCDTLNSQVKQEQNRNQYLKSLQQSNTAISITPIKSDFNEQNCDTLNSQVKLEENRNLSLNSFLQSRTAISITPIKSDLDEDVKLNFKWDKDKDEKYRLKNDFTRKEFSGDISSERDSSSENELNIDERTYDSENDSAEEENV